MAAKGRRKGPSTLERGDVAGGDRGEDLCSLFERVEALVRGNIHHPIRLDRFPSPSSPFSATTKSHGRIHHPPVALYRLRCFSNQVFVSTWYHIVRVRENSLPLSLRWRPAEPAGLFISSVHIVQKRNFILLEFDYIFTDRKKILLARRNAEGRKRQRLASALSIRGT